MATLFGTQIKDTYEGLLKLIDNAGLTATNKSVTDGTGTESGLKLGTGTTVEITKRVEQTGLGGSTFFGESAGPNDDGSNNENTGFGLSSLELVSTGNSNTAVGVQSSRFMSTGSYNTSVGKWAGRVCSTGIFNTAVGMQALQNSSASSYNTGIGANALRNNTTGANNTAVGSSAGAGTNYSGCVYLGYNAGSGQVFGSNTLIINNSASVTPLIFGDFSTQELTINGDLKATSLVIPSAAGYITNTGGYRDSTGALGTAGQVLSTTGAVTTWINASGGGVVGGLQTDDGLALGATNKSITDSLANSTGLKLGTGTTVEVTKRVSQTGLGNSTFFGEDAGLNDNGVGSLSVAIGFQALKTNVSSFNNVAVGREALQNATSASNTAVGSRALKSLTTGGSNTAVGNSCADNLTTGGSNTGMGEVALDNLTTGGQNTAVGWGALRNISSKNFNTAIGNDAGASGYNHSNGTFLGWRAGLGAVGNNQTVIGSGAVGNGTNTVTLGDTNVTELHLAKAGASIALRSPNGTVFKLSVSDAGALVIT